MPDVTPPPTARRNPRTRQYVSVTAPPDASLSEPDDPAIPAQRDEPRVAITVGVADGFRFGCGLILAGAVFYAAFILLVALAVGVAMLLNVPLPLGIGGR